MEFIFVNNPDESLKIATKRPRWASVIKNIGAKMKNTAKTVKLYKISVYKAPLMLEYHRMVHHSFNPAFDEDFDYVADDDGGQDYIIPEGYKIAEIADGGKEFFTKSGVYCHLATNHKNECPYIIDTTGNYARAVYLKKADDKNA